MRKRFLGTVAVASVTMLGGCAGALGWQPPVGGIYSGVKGVTPYTEVEASDGVRPGPKQGKSCTQGVLGVAAWGDMSLDAAKKAGGITRVDTLDYSTMVILGFIYSKNCTIVTGE